MAWVSLDNLTRFYIKLKEKMYLKTEVDTKLSDKANSSHTHDDRYYTESEINSKISTINTTINNISTVYYGDGVDSAIVPLNADQLQGHPASYFENLDKFYGINISNVLASNITSYTATSNCWAVANFNCASAVVRGSVYIDGIMVTRLDISAWNNSSYSKILIPLKIGQQITTSCENYGTCNVTIYGTK